MPPTTNSALQAQILALGERLELGLAEIKTMLNRFDERLRALETRESGCQATLTGSISAAWRKIDEHEAALKNLTALVTAQDNQVKTMKSISVWALGLLTLVLCAVLVALATGQATLVFR